MVLEEEDRGGRVGGGEGGVADADATPSADARRPLHHWIRPSQERREPPTSQDPPRRADGYHLARIYHQLTGSATRPSDPPPARWIDADRPKGARWRGGRGHQRTTRASESDGQVQPPARRRGIGGAGAVRHCSLWREGGRGLREGGMHRPAASSGVDGGFEVREGGRD